MAKLGQIASKPESFFKRPIMIIGTMRSGTTLLGRMLNAHPKIYIRYLETNLVRFYGHRFEPITNRENMVRLVSAVQAETRRNKGEFTDKQKEDILQYLDEAGHSYQNLYAALALFLFGTTKERWGEKYAGDCRDAEYFFDIFPDGQVIQITRDPLDVYASNKKRTASIEKLEPDRRDLMVIEEWKKCYEHSIRLASVYGKKHYLSIKYEDLVSNPKEATRQVCKFLNLDWTDSMMMPRLFVDDGGIPWEANTSFTKFKGIATDPISRYKDYLPQEEQDFIREYLEMLSSNTEKRGFAKFLRSATRNKEHKFQSDLYQKYSEKMRRGFIAAGKYRIGLYVDSVSSQANRNLAEFLYHSYHDVEVISAKFSSEQYRFPVHYLEDKHHTLHDDVDYSQLQNVISNVDFIHVNGQTALTTIIQTAKNSFNKRIFLTNGGDNADTQLLQYCDRIVAKSEKETQYYLSQGIPQSAILQLSEQDLFDNIATIYRNFILDNKILKY